LTAFTLPCHLLRLAGIASGFLTFSFSGVGLLALRPTPNLEDQVSEFISPRDRVAHLCPWTLGNSGSPFPVPTYMGSWGGTFIRSVNNKIKVTKFNFLWREDTE
jgi:hypothetical protein